MNITVRHADISLNSSVNASEYDAGTIVKSSFDRDYLIVVDRDGVKRYVRLTGKKTFVSFPADYNLNKPTLVGTLQIS